MSPYVCTLCRQEVHGQHLCPKMEATRVGYPQPPEPVQLTGTIAQAVEHFIEAPYADKTIIAAVPPPPSRVEEVIPLIEPKKTSKETVSVPFVQGCARCGGDHQDMVFEKLTRPIYSRGVLAANYWAPCPSNGEPILNRVSAG